jgi:hypothetical protein
VDGSSIRSPQSHGACRRPAGVARTRAGRSDLHREDAIAAGASKPAPSTVRVSEPRVLQAQALRLSTYGKPRVIACAEEFPEHIGLPRGCLEELCEALADLRVRVDLRDERYGGQPLRVRFQGGLRAEQQRAADAMLAHDIRVLAATTAFGKTVVAAWLIAERGVNTLIDRVGDYGHLIVDECHHLSAQSFERVARKAKARFVTGLSATIARKDGHHPIILMQCGLFATE